MVEQGDRGSFRREPYKSLDPFLNGSETETMKPKRSMTEREF